MGGFGTSVTKEIGKIIESILGKLIYDDCDDADTGIARFDEPLVSSAVRIHCRQALLDHMSSHWSALDDPVSRGLAFERQIPMVIVDVLGDFAPLEDLLEIAEDSKFAHLAKREFRLVSVRMDLGKYVASAVSATSGPCPQLAYKTETAIDYLNYVKTPGGAAIIYPDKLEGPDVHNAIQDKNTGKIVDLVTQAKLSVSPDGVRGDVCRKGVESLEPSRFHQRYDKKVLTHSIAALRYFAPANLVYVFRLVCISGGGVGSYDPIRPGHSEAMEKNEKGTVPRVYTS